MAKKAKSFACDNPSDFRLSTEMIQSFWQDGYILIRGLFDKDEMSLMKKAVVADEIVDKSYGIAGDSGRDSRLALWKHPGDDFLGKVARCEKLVNACEDLLKDEVYHYHTKLMMKDARTGGKIIWHQDYGYWYKNGNLFPDMITAFIAVDRSSEANGCLRVVRGSHKIGRIDHVLEGGQQGADLKRVDEILKHSGLSLELVEQEPGDCLLFHCLVMHYSEGNNSDDRRWMLSVAYNTKHNDPIYVHHHPNYTKLHKVPNADVKNCKVLTDITGKEFLNPADDLTVLVAGEDKVKKGAK